MKLRADNGACEAHGQCAMIDDELFVLDDDGYVAIAEDLTVPPDKEREARLGVGACPVPALRVE